MATVLIAEDPKSSRSIQKLLEQQNPRTEARTVSPDQVLHHLSHEDYEVLLVDIGAIDDATEWLDQLRQDFPDLPIVLVGSPSPRDSVSVKTLILGAASFMPRNRMSRDLSVTVDRIVALCCGDHGEAIGHLLRASQFHYELKNDRDDVALIVRHVINGFEHFGICGRADRVRVAVAIEEALVNALVHGNLEVPSDLRERPDDAYEQLIAARRTASPYRERRARLIARFSHDEGTIVISDEGPGFAPEDVPDPTDPENLVKPHGRGLLLMRTFMDEVHYNDKGNEVTMIKFRAKEAEL